MSCKLELIFCVLDFIFRLLKSNMSKKRSTRILECKPWLMHIIKLDIDWRGIIFSYHIFCSMLLEQAIDLTKVGIDKLSKNNDNLKQGTGSHWFLKTLSWSIFDVKLSLFYIINLWYHSLVVSRFYCREEVLSSFITTTVWDESQVTPQGHHR